MLTVQEQLEAQRLSIVGGRQRDNSDFSTAFERALEEYRTKPRCPKCDHEQPPPGGPYCDCKFGQIWLKTHRELAEAEKSRDQARRAERRKRLTEKLQKAGGFVIPEKYKGFTLETLRTLAGSAEYKKREPTINKIKAWATDKLERPGLLISGDYGVGKSALCFQAVRYRVSQTAEVPLLLRYGEFIGIVQKTYQPGSKNHKLDFIRGAQQAEILMLDDFGQVNLSLGTEATPDKQEIMLEVLDYRTQHDMPTLIITNLTQGRLMAQFNGAITGRLMELCVFEEMKGKNLREKGAVGWQT